ncbi:MAG TPA: DMT family transporter [Ilumatobacteraceae bacterium]|nr:DMT family transporter [Ilumatobacteraceae bacterium]
MATARRDVRRGIAWAALSATAYSASAVLGKHLLQDLRANDMLFWRFSIAIPVCWFVLAARAWRGGPNPLGVRRRPLVAVGVLFCGMSWIGFVALDHLDASLYIVLVYVYPALVAAAAPLFGQRISGATWMAIGVAIVGISLTVPDVFQGAGRGDAFGVVLTLVQAVALATYTIVSSRVVTARADGLVTMGWSLVGSWLGMAVLAVAVGLRLPSDGRVAAELVSFAIVPTIVSGACFYQALRFLAPTRVAMIAILEPVLTIVWAVLLLGEGLRAIQLVGGLLVLVGVVWAQRSAGQVVVAVARRRRTRKREKTSSWSI